MIGCGIPLDTHTYRQSAIDHAIIRSNPISRARQWFERSVLAFVSAILAWRVSVLFVFFISRFFFDWFTKAIILPLAHTGTAAAHTHSSASREHKVRERIENWRIIIYCFLMFARPRCFLRCGEVVCVVIISIHDYHYLPRTGRRRTRCSNYAVICKKWLVQWLHTIKYTNEFSMSFSHSRSNDLVSC